MRQRFTVIPAVYIVLRKDDEVLLIRRMNTGYRDGEYAFPAGHLDGNESALMAAVREAKEEVGVDIDPKDMEFLQVLHRRAEEGDHERVDFVFQTTRWQGEPYNAEPHKSDDVRWFNLRDLPATATPVLRAMSDNLLHGRTYSSHNFAGEQ